MKIDNLISNLQKNTAEQDKIIKEQAENVTRQHLESYNALLTASNRQTESILQTNLQLIENQQSKIKDALRLNTLKAAVLGSLALLFLIFLGINVWLGYQIKHKTQQLDQLNLAIDQTPLEKRVLSMVDLHESQDKKTYFIVAKNIKKAEAYTTTGKDKVLKIQR